MGELKITIVRKKIKNLYMRVISPEELLITCNKHVTHADINRFILNKQAWIDRCIHKMKESPIEISKKIDAQSTVLFAERRYVLSIEKAKTNSIKQVDEYLLISLKDPSDNELLNKLILKWYKQNFYHYAVERVHAIYNENRSKQIIFPSKISIKDTKTRWGSYSKKTNTISLSIRLGAYSREAIDSVIYHELAHTRYMDHQKNFYSLLLDMMPNYAQLHKELKLKKPKDNWYLG